MPDALAARRLARRSREGGRRAAFMRSLRARALTGAALVGVCSVLYFSAAPLGRAHAAGAAANTPTAGVNSTTQGVRPALPVPHAPSEPRAALPGLNPPPATPGTTASGPVRLQPARMPFYVATRGATTIYVLGTLHVGDPADYPPTQPFRPPIMGALAASPTLALELSPDELLVSQDDVSKYGVCRRDCLPGLLPEPLWRKLAFRLRGNPAALDEIKKMRPWLASLLVETYDSLSAGLQTEYGTEAQLQNVYLRTRGKIIGLETLPQQMRAFTGLTLAQQREMLAQDLMQTPAQNVEDVRTLHRLWRVGDADAIAAWEAAKTEKLARDKQVSNSIDDRIVYARNRRFVSRMLQIAAPNKPVFVAIGALHLGGRKGVLQLLRQHGFVVDAG
ncbi:TraB/GumN family protein [Paraburkholderia strydomiana]|uniref:TraB/GumN family protein n=1 Tax=Paraburkholderia strydomiana TaxID=1245417 RepID=UPI0038B826AE